MSLSTHRLVVKAARTSQYTPGDDSYDPCLTRVAPGLSPERPSTIGEKVGSVKHPPPAPACTASAL